MALNGTETRETSQSRPSKQGGGRLEGAGDSAGQNETLPEIEEKRLRAMAALLAGASAAKAAKVAGVARSTLYRWMLQPDFRRPLRVAQESQRLMIEAQLTTTAERAAENVAKAVENGDLRASLAVLRGVGLLDGLRNRPGAQDGRSYLR